LDTVAELIEKMVIVNIRLWNLMDVVAGEEDDKKCAQAARDVVKVNKHRAALKQELDKRFGDHSADIKMYGVK